MAQFQFSAQSAKICLNFNFGGGGYSWVVKTQSAKIDLNFKTQRPKFQFFVGEGEGVFLGSQIENWYSSQFGQKILEAWLAFTS